MHNHKKLKSKWTCLCSCLILCGLFFFVGLSLTHADEIRIPAVVGTPGSTVKIPIMMDQVENLAGMKIVLNYDKKTLLFKSVAKTTYTNSLMHIVNDKKPGVLIIVMAGARGIKGKKISLLTMSFQINKDAQPPDETVLKISGIQLMSDKLKEFKADVKIEPVKIVNATSPG